MIALEGLNGPATHLAFSPDGGSLIGSNQIAPFQTVVWDVPAVGKPRLSWPGVREAAFAPGGRFVAVDAGMGPEPFLRSSMRIIDPKVEGPGAVPFIISDAVPDFPDDVLSEDVFYRRLRFMPDGHTFVALGGSRQLRWWSWPAVEELHGLFTVPGLPHPGAFAFSPDGWLLAMFDTRGAVLVFDIDSGRQLWEAAVYSSRRPHITFSPNGRWVAGASGSGLRVFDVATGERVAKIDTLPIITGLAFTPDGRFLATSHPTGRVEFLDTRTWRHGPAFNWKAGGLASLAFSPDGMLAAAGAGRHVVVWDLDV